MRSLREGLDGAPDAPVRVLLAVPQDASDARLASAMVHEIARLDTQRLASEAARGTSAGPGTSLLPVPHDDPSFLGRLKPQSDIEGEQSVAAMVDVPTLLSVLRAGSLSQRRAAARRLAERLSESSLAAEDRRRIQALVEQVRDVEIAYELLACHALLSGDLSREAQRTRREVLEWAAQLELDVMRYWEGDLHEEPLMKLSGDARAQLMMHARDLSDPLLWHVSALIEGSSGAPDPQVQRALLASVRYAADPRLVPSLIALLDARDGKLVMEAARALGRIEDGRVWPALLAAYERSLTDLERVALGAALGRLGDKRAAAYIRAQLRNEDERVSTRALEGLRTVGAADDVPAVLSLLHGSDSVLATKAAHTLGRISDGRGLPELLRVAQESAVSSLRGAAEEALQQIEARLVLRGEEPSRQWTPAPALPERRDMVTSRAPPLVQLRALRLFALGRLWQLMGAGERAIARFEAAARCRPDWATPIIVAATLYAARDEYGQALALFRRALELSRGKLERNPIVIRHLARCFLRRAEQVERDGRIAIARGLLEEVLALDLRRVPSSLRFEIGRRHEALRSMGAG